MPTYTVFADINGRYEFASSTNGSGVAVEIDAGHASIGTENEGKSGFAFFESFLEFDCTSAGIGATETITALSLVLRANASPNGSGTISMVAPTNWTGTNPTTGSWMTDSQRAAATVLATAAYTSSSTFATFTESSNNWRSIFVYNGKNKIVLFDMASGKLSDWFSGAAANTSATWPVLTITTTAASVQDVDPTGIASGEAEGSPTVTEPQFVTPSGIATAAQFGAATVEPDQPVGPAGGIASGEAEGAPTVTLPDQLAPSGIASGEIFGSDRVAENQLVAPGGLASGETFGSAGIADAPGTGVTYTYTSDNSDGWVENGGVVSTASPTLITGGDVTKVGNNLYQAFVEFDSTSFPVPAGTLTSVGLKVTFEAPPIGATIDVYAYSWGPTLSSRDYQSDLTGLTKVATGTYAGGVTSLTFTEIGTGLRDAFVRNGQTRFLLHCSWPNAETVIYSGDAVNTISLRPTLTVIGPSNALGIGLTGDGIASGEAEGDPVVTEPGAGSGGGGGGAGGTALLRIFKNGAWVSTIGSLARTTLFQATDCVAVDGQVILMDASGGPKQVTLPASLNGAQVTVKKTDSSENPVNVVSPLAIDGGGTFQITDPLQSQDFFGAGLVYGWALV